MTTITALPTPTIKTPHSYHEPGRSRHIDYPVRVREDGQRIIVRISAMHSKSHKRFVASVNRIVIEDRPGTGFVAEKYRPMEGFRGLPQQPVGRFSAKALDAYVAYLVAEFPGWVESIPALAEKFAEHAETDND